MNTNMDVKPQTMIIAQFVLIDQILCKNNHIDKFMNKKIKL